MVLSSEAKAYKAQVKALTAGTKPYDGDVSVELVVFRPRKSGDLDNRIKIVLDALKGIAFHDDKQVVEIKAYRDDDKEWPRVRVCVEEKK